MLIQKKNYIRDKEWRKFVSSLPCAKCKIEGRTQAAHLERGGMGIKGSDDSCFPLCTVSNSLGCHEKLDRHLERWFWDERYYDALSRARDAYNYWLNGDEREAERLFRGF